MPRYLYQCKECDHATTVFHRISETPETICEKCGIVMYKAVSRTFSTKFVETKKQKVGQITKEYIEKNKEILEQQKEEASKEEYE